MKTLLALWNNTRRIPGLCRKLRDKIGDGNLCRCLRPLSASCGAQSQQQNSAPIGIVIQDLGGTGVQRFVLTIAEGLAAAGHRVDLILRNAKGEYLPDVRDFARVCTLHARKRNLRRALRRTVHPSVRIVHFGPRWSPLWFSKWRVAARLSGTKMPALIDSRYAHDILAIADYIRCERPSALLANLEGAEIVALCGNRFVAQKTRVAAVLHGIASKRPPDALRIDGIILPWADQVVGVSAGAADDAAQTFNLPRRNISTVYNPVKVPASLMAEEPAHVWFKDSPGDVILAAGRLSPGKDFPTLLRAFARLADKKLRLVVVGEGDERATLEKLAGELGIAGRVGFPGWVANPFALMARARLFVFSSRHEGLPTALIEALACGCPVVSTDCPHGPREILEGGKWGRLVPVGDNAALATAMEGALQMEPDRAALKRRAEFFSVEKAVKEYEKILFGDENTPEEKNAAGFLQRCR